jgi:curved DNA-binding protein CbpA
MDIITLNNKQYDPYFILDVTKDDTYEHISKSFRKKVKKYHPDKYTDKKQKEKYECYFKILSQSFEYIKNKRKNVNDLQINRNNKKIEKDNIKIKSSKKDIDEFNNNFEIKKNKKKEKKEKSITESDYKQIKNTEEYLDFKPSYYNPLSKKKFTNKEFNEIFEYNKKIQEIDDDEIKKKSIIHVTTDGFNGYNSGQLNNNCALVSSYSGLMVTGDNETGVGYWSNDYSDYKISFKLSAKNPDSKFKIKNEKNKNEKNKNEKNKNEKDKNEKDKNENNKNEKNKNENNKIYQGSGSFKTQEQNFVKNTYESLLRKEQKDKEIVLKHLYQYDDETIKKALNGELEKSVKYSSILQKYIQ